MSAIIRKKPTESGPWCWQEKDARRIIREQMDGDHKTPYVLGVYDALTEIASNEQRETFTTLQGHLAMMSGCGTSMVKIALRELLNAGLIQVTTPKLRGPCTFTLLAVSRNAANDSRDMASISHESFLGDTATVEEKKKKGSEERRNKAAAAIALLPLPFPSPEFAHAWSDWQEHLREKRKPPTSKATEAQLKKCADMGEARAIAMIRRSIENNWQGLFEASATTAKPKRSKPTYAV